MYSKHRSCIREGSHNFLNFISGHFMILDFWVIDKHFSSNDVWYNPSSQCSYHNINSHINWKLKSSYSVDFAVATEVPDSSKSHRETIEKHSDWDKFCLLFIVVWKQMAIWVSLDVSALLLFIEFPRNWWYVLWVKTIEDHFIFYFF